MASSTRALSLLFVAVATLAAGCNDDDSDVAAAPVPAPAPGSSPAPAPAPASPASECFPTQSGIAGTTYKLDYAVSGALTGTSSTTGTATAASFEGVNGLIAQVQTITTNYTAPALLAGTTTTEFSYFQAFDGHDIVSYGTTSTTNVAGTGNVTTRVVYTPPVRDKRFTLDEGSTQDFPSTAAVTVTPPGNTTNTPLSVYLTYSGQESITVPAGTFTACKFHTNNAGYATTEWLIKGNGMLARSTSQEQGGEVVMELLPSSRLNGAAF